MNITDIPFINLTGLRINQQGVLTQPFDDHTRNHLGTMHAGIQFSLAETASGFHLQQQFPQLADQVIPVLRETRIKYRKPVTEEISAHPQIEDDARERFLRQMNSRKRSTIEVIVTLKDKSGNSVCTGWFTWFVQRKE